MRTNSPEKKIYTKRNTTQNTLVILIEGTDIQFSKWDNKNQYKDWIYI